MKDYLLILPLTIIYLAIKSTLLPTVPVPDLPLLVIFYFAYRKPSAEVALLAFALGYVEDLFGAGVTGSTSFSLVIIFLAVLAISKKVHFSTPLVNACMVAGLSLAKGLLIYFTVNFVGIEASFIGYIIAQSFITGIFTPATLSLFAKVSSWKNQQTFER